MRTFVKFLKCVNIDFRFFNFDFGFNFLDFESEMHFPLMYRENRNAYFLHICIFFKGLGGFHNFNKSIFFCLFNNTICLEYSLLYGAGIDDSV